MAFHDNKVHTISDSSDDEEIQPLTKRLQPTSSKSFDSQYLTGNIKDFNSKSDFHSVYCTEDASITTTQPIVSETSKLKRCLTDNVDKQHLKLKLQLDREEMKRRKDDEKELRKKELEDKKLQKEYEKAKKKTIRDAQKSIKPGEAIKHMTVMIDPGVMKGSSGALILDVLQKQNINYEIHQQALQGMITFWREVTEMVEAQPFRLDTQKKEVVEAQILLVLSVSDFVQMVHNFKQKQLHSLLSTDCETLTEHILKVKQALEDRLITLIIHGMDSYFRDQHTKGQRDYRSKVSGEETKRKKTKAEHLPLVSRLEVEEALIHAQLYTSCSVRFVKTEMELAKSVLQYTKAVAEAPYKQDRLNTGLSLFIDVSGSIKISKDGQGVPQAWRQQLQQFRNVTAEVANAIIREYPTPLKLWQAYNNCDHESEKEFLLQDIMIRRGVGVMATSRRVGKELSRRLYHLFTADDPDLVLH